MRTMYAEASRALAPAAWSPAIAGGVMLTLALAMHVAPRGDWLYLLLATIAMLTLLWAQGWRLEQARLPAPTALALIAFGTLAIVGELWGAIPGKALASGGAFAGIVLLAAVASDCMARLENETVHRAVFGLMVGCLAGLAFLIFEAATDFALQRWLYSEFPGLARPGDKHLRLLRNHVARIDASTLKRNMSQAALLLWPLVLLLQTQWPARHGRFVAAGLVACTLVAGVLARHDSSNLALAASLAAFLAALLSFRWTWRVVVGLWLLMTLFVVPIMLMQYEGQVYQQTWIQQSGRHRMVIWGYTANEVAKAPLLGIGAGSGKGVDARRTDAELVPGEIFEYRTADHQHDFYLQAWYEMGLAGAVTLCVAGLIDLRRIRRLPEGVRSYALATLVSAMFLVSTSYGLWQEWFVASIAIAAVAMTLAVRYASPDAFDLPRHAKV
jgi:hypothetical protein